MSDKYRVFISQPMNNRSEEDILLERDSVLALCQEKNPEKRVIEIPSYFGPHSQSTPLESLAMGLGMMASADKVYFVPGWDKTRGCKIEHLCCEEYGLPYEILTERDML